MKISNISKKFDLCWYLVPVEHFCRWGPIDNPFISPCPPQVYSSGICFDLSCHHFIVFGCRLLVLRYLSRVAAHRWHTTAPQCTCGLFADHQAHSPRKTESDCLLRLSTEGLRIPADCQLTTAASCRALHKEALQTLCDAVQARADDGEEACWMDSAGNPLHTDLWWSQAPGYARIISMIHFIKIICINFIMQPTFSCNRSGPSGRLFRHSMQYLITSHDATAHSSFSGMRRRGKHGV